MKTLREMDSAALSHGTLWHYWTASEQNAVPSCCARKKRSEKMAIPLVSIIDDDESVRESLPRLVKAFGYSVHAFSSPEEFLASGRASQTGCLILDISMPGMSGPKLQSELGRRQLEIPIIFITAQRDETVRISMLERGAVECLFKPFSGAALLQALKTAFRA